MIFEKLEEYGCEEVAFFHNKDLGLKAIVAIRETALGQAVGGTRMRGYPSEEETLIDVLKLTSGMSRISLLTGRKRLKVGYIFAGTFSFLYSNVAFRSVLAKSLYI